MSDRTKPQPTLIPQPNGGALLSGGKPGNRGGGRRPSAIRAKCRDHFITGLEYVKQVAGGQIDVPGAQRLRAIDMLGKYGLRDQEKIMPDQLVEALSKSLGAHMEPDRIASVVADLLKNLEQDPMPTEDPAESIHP